MILKKTLLNGRLARSSGACLIILLAFKEAQVSYSTIEGGTVFGAIFTPLAAYSRCITASRLIWLRR